MLSFYTSKRGFIALLSVIIISLLLLGLVATANTAGFFSRFSELDGEYKLGSYSLAEACVNVALLNLAQNYSYAPGNQQVMVDSDSCYIDSIATTATTGTRKTVLIKAHSAYKNTFTNLEVTVQVQNPAVAGATITPNIVLVSQQEVL
jgi:hypothetical protein